MTTIFTILLIFSLLGINNMFSAWSRYTVFNQAFLLLGLLSLIDREPDELWTEARDTVQETGIKTIPMEKKCKKAKWLSEEATQIAVTRREVKSKGEKERYTHLNAEFQRIARRDKKPSSAINAKKYRKTIEQERLEISSRKFKRYQGNISCKDRLNKGQKL